MRRPRNEHRHISHWRSPRDQRRQYQGASVLDQLKYQVGRQHAPELVLCLDAVVFPMVSALTAFTVLQFYPVPAQVQIHATVPKKTSHTQPDQQSSELIPPGRVSVAEPQHLFLVVRKMALARGCRLCVALGVLSGHEEPQRQSCRSGQRDCTHMRQHP